MSKKDINEEKKSETSKIIKTVEVILRNTPNSG
jgi:hypothetical protein